MLPRHFYIRRCFLYMLGVTCFVFIVINFRQNVFHDGYALFRDRQTRQISPPSQSAPAVISSCSLSSGNAHQALTALDLALDDNQQHTVCPYITVNEKEERKPTQVEKKMSPETKETIEKKLKMNEKLRPWFLSGGKRRPAPAKVSKATGKRVARLWPQEEPGSDRILNQLMFYPPNRGHSHGEENQLPLKKIFVPHGTNLWGFKPGQESFKYCPVNSCAFTANKAESLEADAILFKDVFEHPGHHHPYRQVWIIYFGECPYHTKPISYNDVFNWTATYRRDSDIVNPYGKWIYYNESQMEYPGPLRDFVGNKTDQVAWFVSNCDAKNSRLQYAHELAKYIQVDIYGDCGKLKCPRSEADKCFEMLAKKYKFYLAFENSNCKDYITEKLFVNGLGHNVLPIVMGAPPEDYYNSAPRHSYIHVDDFKSPKELAAYLLKLDADNDLYNSYFKWKGMGEILKTYFLCRLCALLHDDNFPLKSYHDINEWWRGAGICTNGTPRKANKNLSLNNKIMKLLCSVFINLFIFISYSQCATNI